MAINDVFDRCQAIRDCAALTGISHQAVEQAESRGLRWLWRMQVVRCTCRGRVAGGLCTACSRRAEVRRRRAA